MNHDSLVLRYFYLSTNAFIHFLIGVMNYNATLYKNYNRDKNTQNKKY